MTWKINTSELQGDIDKTDDDDDYIILIEQKEKEMIKEIEPIMESVET